MRLSPAFAVELQRRMRVMGKNVGIILLDINGRHDLRTDQTVHREEARL